MPRARSASSVDLPTPEPAKTPMRWPRATGRMVSKTAEPGGEPGAEPLARRRRRRRAAQRGAGGARASAAGRRAAGRRRRRSARPSWGPGWTPAAPSRVTASPTAAPSHRRIGHGAGQRLGDADDLAAERRAAAEADRHLVADPRAGSTGRRSRAPPCRPRPPGRRGAGSEMRASSAPRAAKSVSIGRSPCGRLPFVQPSMVKPALRHADNPTTEPELPRQRPRRPCRGAPAGARRERRPRRHPGLPGARHRRLRRDRRRRSGPSPPGRPGPATSRSAPTPAASSRASRQRSGPRRRTATSVSLEDQMMRAAEVRQGHEMAIGVYAKSLDILRAARDPALGSSQWTRS